MARAATTADAFNAVAEPRRRQILDLLAGGERPVNDLVAVLGMSQPQVSKHLRVLREVGLSTSVRKDGSGCIGSTDGAQAHSRLGEGLRALWTERFEQLDAVLEELEQEEEVDAGDDQPQGDDDAPRG